MSSDLSLIEEIILVTSFLFADCAQSSDLDTAIKTGADDMRPI